MKIILKYREIEDPTNVRYIHNIEGFNKLWTLVRSVITSDFDYIEIEVIEK